MRVYLVQSERSALLVAIKEYAAQDHASTSVYTETACLSNNLLGILTPKINTFGKKKLAWYEWELTKSILAQAKSVTLWEKTTASSSY